ncbi:hypothetical protein HGM15179_004711, partial [Zosterops borbonicus]
KEIIAELGIYRVTGKEIIAELGIYRVTGRPEEDPIEYKIVCIVWSPTTGSFPGALVLQKQTVAPPVLSTWSQVQSTNLLQHGVPSPLFTGPDRTLLHHGLPRESQPPLESDLLYGGNLYWLQVDGYLLLHGLPWAGLWGDHCFTMTSITDCWGISALVPRALPPSSTSLKIYKHQSYGLIHFRLNFQWRSDHQRAVNLNSLIKYNGKKD